MSDNIMFHFDDNFQLGIFELMMNDSSFCEKATLLLKAEYFKNQHYAWFFSKNKELLEEHGSVPTHIQVRNEILRFVPEKRETYLAIFQKITRPTNQRNYNYIRKNLEEFIKKAIMFQLNDSLVRSQNKSSEYIGKLMSDKVDEYNKVSFSKAQCQNLGQLTTIMETSKEDACNLIPTFLPNIDRALGGGIPRNTLSLGLSGTNAGKSIWLINWAYHLIKNGFKVFYVNLEGYESQAILRLASRAIGAQLGDVKWNRLTDIQNKKKEHFETKYKDSIQFYNDCSFGFCLEDLVPIARQKKEEFDFDVMIVDYAQILQSKEKFSDLRHQQSYVHRALSSLSSKKDLDCAMITVAQGNRETQNKNNQGKGLIRMGDISECFEIVRACAQVFTLNRSEQDIEMETARILLDKSRDGKTNVLEIVKTNFSRMAFYGNKDEGLGFMMADDYFHSTNSKGK